MKSAPTIAFDYRPSRWIGAVAALICGAAACAPWLSSLSLAARIVISSGVIAFGAMEMVRFWRPRVRIIAYRQAGWLIVAEDGGEHAAVLVGHAHLGPLVALDIRIAREGRQRVLLTPDNLDVQTRRRLILMLARAEIVHAP